jgi:mono/diheme cytochrome c family protein
MIGRGSHRMTRWAVLTAGLACATAVAGLAVADGAGSATEAPSTEAVRRGAYLVNAGGCNDCHTPWKMGASGPEPDLSRFLSGHPETMALPPAPAPSGPWIVSAAASMTAWSGPWGVSYSANLTPDPETGLGQWTEEQFVAAIRSGRHMGRGRPILPPMPWPAMSHLTDADLGAIFAYLRTLPPVRNHVPEPAAPAQR